MTKQLRAAIEVIIDCLEKPTKILEIGSRQAMNQNEIADMRELFPAVKFVGLDMQAGIGVDIVASAEKLPFADKSFDLVLCFETLEHAERPWLVCAEIERVLTQSGVAIISSQQNFPIHKHPSDYFRYTPFGMSALFPKFLSKLVVAISPPFDNEVKLNPQHIILIGSKAKKEKLVLKLRKALRKNIQKISVHKPYLHRLEEIGRLLRRAINEISFRQDIEFFQ